MDFVQRNLINERNNLQIELAKAKLLIAQLSEAYSPKLAYRSPTEHSTIDKDKQQKKADMSRPEHKGFVSNNKELVSDNVQDKNTPSTPSKSLPFKTATPSKRHFTPEQTQYISDLENVIVALAESMNVSVEELMEFNSPRNLQRLAGMARATSPNHPTGLIPLGRGIPQAENAGQRIGAMLKKSGTPGAQGGEHGIQVAARDPFNDSHFNGYKDVGPNTSIEFHHPNVQPKVKADAGDQVRRLSKVGIDRRAAAKEQQSRTF